MSDQFKFGWIIKVLEKDKDFVIEIADLNNGKSMIVATDIAYPITKDSYRQSGYGPFLHQKDDLFDEQIKILKNDLLKRRINV